PAALVTLRKAEHTRRTSNDFLSDAPNRIREVLQRMNIFHRSRKTDGPSCSRGLWNIRPMFA
uniref:Uncharacterized protein n=1 Tax=Anopheles atroparvus TaxID=41427 RepID=A0AAG5DJ81_ANOAO